MIATSVSADMTNNIIVAGIFSDTLRMGDLTMISVEDYKNFITKIDWIGTTGKNEISEQETIEIFPNPATDQINIVLPLNEELLFFELFDKYGKQISMHNRNSINGNITLDVSGLPSGVYFIYFYTKNKEVIYKKVIII